MGFVEREVSGGGNSIFISKGNFVTYENRKKVVHENMAFRGHVLGIDFDMRKDFHNVEQENILLYIRDSVNDEYVVIFQLESGYGNAFAKMAKNVDWKRPVELSAGVQTKDNRSYGSLFISQPNEAGKWENIKWAYTKDNLGKCPPPEVKSDRNGTYNDYTKQNAFLRKLLVDLVGKELKKLHPKFDPAQLKKKSQEASPADAVNEPIDDLPF